MTLGSSKNIFTRSDQAHAYLPSYPGWLRATPSPEDSFWTLASSRPVLPSCFSYLSPLAPHTSRCNILHNTPLSPYFWFSLPIYGDIPCRWAWDWGGATGKGRHLPENQKWYDHWYVSNETRGNVYNCVSFTKIYNNIDLPSKHWVFSLASSASWPWSRRLQSWASSVDPRTGWCHLRCTLWIAWRVVPSLRGSPSGYRSWRSRGKATAIWYLRRVERICGCSSNWIDHTKLFYSSDWNWFHVYFSHAFNIKFQTSCSY